VPPTTKPEEDNKEGLIDRFNVLHQQIKALQNFKDKKAED